MVKLVYKDNLKISRNIITLNHINNLLLKRIHKNSSMFKVLILKIKLNKISFRSKHISKNLLKHSKTKNYPLCKMRVTSNKIKQNNSHNIKRVLNKPKCNTTNKIKRGVKKSNLFQTKRLLKLNQWKNLVLLKKNNKNHSTSPKAIRYLSKRSNQNIWHCRINMEERKSNTSFVAGWKMKSVTGSLWFSKMEPKWKRIRTKIWSKMCPIVIMIKIDKVLRILNIRNSKKRRKRKMINCRRIRKNLKQRRVNICSLEMMYQNTM